MSPNILAHNLMAMNAGRQLKLNEKDKSAVMERLSSGYRINRAADDASGLAMSEKMRRQIRGLTQGAYNIQEGISYCKVADGALNEISDIMNRMEELAVKAANGTNSANDRQAIDDELQQLKAETERILGTTKYNEIYIWRGGEPKFDTVRTGSTYVNAVNYSYYSATIALTNNNKAAYPVNGTIRIDTDETNGFRFYWTGYNGNTYYSNWKGWPDDITSTINDPDNPNQKISRQHPGSVSVKLSDLMDYTTYPETVGIEASLSYSTNAYTTQSELITSLKNSYFSVTPSTSHYLWTYNNDGTRNTTVSTSVSLTYPAVVKSERDLDNTADTSFARANPSNGTNLISKPSGSNGSYSGTWTFQYDFDNIGTVTATMSGVTYSLSSLSEKDKGIWWHWYPDENSPHRSQSRDSKSAPNGNTVSGVIYALTNTANGLLTADLDQDKADYGSITISFSLRANTGFKIENGTTTYTDVGSMSLTMSGISENESVDDVMRRLLTINGSDIFASSSASNNSDSGGVGSNSGNSKLYSYSLSIENPLYTQVELHDPTPEKTIPIHTAPESTEDVRILITYPILNNKLLGLTDTNVLTAEDALQALEDIQYAAEMVSDNRVLFGAYQNRLEHAYNGTMNTVENTTASESRIRDADMAELMYWYSLNQILVNAGESMLAQATKNPETVLKLIQ